MLYEPEANIPGFHHSVPACRRIHGNPALGGTDLAQRTRRPTTKKYMAQFAYILARFAIAFIE